MKEHPILMSAPMVRATLREVDPKTQTRRIVKPEPTWEKGWYCSRGFVWKNLLGGSCVSGSPYGKRGDRLWVREAWREDSPDDPERAIYRADNPVDLPPGFKWKPSIFMPRWASRITLEITDVRVQRLRDISEADAVAEGLIELVPPTNRGEGLSQGALAIAAAATVANMPRMTRRRFLGGALAATLGFAAGAKPWEVADGHFKRAPTARELYGMLFDQINGAGSWDANPWVWAVSFRRISQQQAAA